MMADFPMEITRPEVARWLFGRADRFTVVHKADCILADIVESKIPWDEGNKKWENLRKQHPSKSGKPYQMSLRTHVINLEKFLGESFSHLL